MRRTYRVAGHFPVSPGLILTVRDGNGNVCERITENGSSSPFENKQTGEMQKDWKVTIQIIKEVY